MVRGALRRLRDPKILRTVLVIPFAVLGFALPSDNFHVKGLVLLAAWMATGLAWMRWTPPTDEERPNAIIIWSAFAVMWLIVALDP